MEILETLVVLKGKVSEECFQDIMDITEGLFVKDGRGDLMDDISRAFTGKPLSYHIKKGAHKIYNATKDKVLKTAPVRNTIGKKELKDAMKELDYAELDHAYNKDCQKYSKGDPSRQRMYAERAKELNKVANQKARKVNAIKDKYGFQ